MNNIFISLYTSVFSHLPNQDGLPEYWMISFYGIPCLAIILALINALLCVLILSDRGNRWSVLVMKNAHTAFVISLIVQGFMAFAPVILCVKGVIKQYEFSVFVYGMPVLQFCIVALCVVYQIKILKEYGRNSKALLTKH